MITDDTLAQTSHGTCDAIDPFETEIDFHIACYRFSAALTTLRIAMTAADKATETQFVLAIKGTPDKLHDLQARRAAASRVMSEAIDSIVKEGFAVLEATQALLTV